ncbi:MAG: sugar ABC transporter permease [Clostridiales bacterium]|nr:sugar ABC transporter permease [Clostridiales bacterium]
MNEALSVNSVNKKEKRDKKRRVLLKKYASLYCILAVIIGYYIVFHYIPIVWGVLISFKNMKIGHTIMGAPWAGLENYKVIFTEPEMLGLIRNTLYLSVLRLIWGFWPSIVLTIFLFDLLSNKFRRFCQTIVYIPHFFSWVIIYGMVFAFFSGNGFINNFMAQLDFERHDYLMDPKWFRPLLIGSQIWKGVGWGTILYFAALTNVNPELYEAAKIDGAGPIQRIRVVTLPAMMPVVVFSLIISLGNILNNDFEQILMFYNPAVYEVADIIDTWVYRVGLGKLQYSIGSAVGMLKAVISFVLIVIANNVASRVSGRGLW